MSELVIKTALENGDLDKSFSKDNKMNKNKRGWWSISMQLSLNGEKVYFEDLSEVSQEHIAECIKQGYLQGELNEEE